MLAPETAHAKGPLARCLAAWDWIERIVVGLLGAFALVIAVLQVFGRYIDPADAITWAEEVIVYVAVWAVMIIASDLVRTNGHVRPDLVLRLMGSRGQRWVESFNCLVALAFTFGMVWYGWDVVSTALLLDQRSSSDLQFPMWIYYLALPVGGGLMFLRYCVRLFMYVFRFDPRIMTIGHSISHEAPDELTKLPAAE
ncbi:MAG TPA: TRAP transporter small permease [Acetobacteraceae bacterium]|jgi:C4-dicarboxylate transporter DctQ subunit|nr:TRAP transporter small permease [Acetobacteraceae bacterium]